MEPEGSWPQSQQPTTFMVITVHQYQSLYYPTNAHNVKNVELLKHIKLIETAATFFGLQRNYHQGATASA